MFKRILTETDMLDYIINFIPVPLVVTDEEYMIVESNKSASSLLALNEETSLTGTPLSDFFPNTQSDGVNSIKRIKTAAEQAEEGEEISLELLTKKITGKVFTSKITFSVIPKENGHLLLLSIVDLSHEYDLINKVKVKASDLVNIIKDSPNPIFLTDDNFNIKIANRAAIALSGYTHETLTKMNMNDFDYISEEGDRLDIILSGSERSKAKSIIRFPSGEKIVERNAIVVSKDEKKSGEILISFNDLTESERLNREISDKAAWYESILDAVPFPISVTDLEKRWTFVNTATETEVGSSRQEIIGKKCTFWGNPSCNTNNCPFDQLKSGRTVIELIIGDKIYEAHSNYVHDSSGNDTGVTILLVDVTKLRRVSSYMEQSVRNITGDLKKLADGTSDLSLITIPADKYTKNEEKYFIEINNAISEAKTSLSMLVEDSLDIASAAVEGYLYIRSDPDNHKGQYAKVIEGINETVDSIEAVA